jgi:hypothetical protein
MRKIPCDCCDNRFGDYAIWIIFDRVFICETCRLNVIETMQSWGFGLDYAHPFMVEFIRLKR